MNVEMIIPNRTWRKLTGKNVVKKQCKNATCLLLSHCTWKLCDVLLCDVLNEQLHRANKRITIAYPSSEQASFAKDNHMTFCLHSLNNIIFLYKMHISVLFVHLHFACIFFTTSIQGVTKPKRIPPANTLIPPWTPPPIGTFHSQWPQHTRSRCQQRKRRPSPGGCMQSTLNETVIMNVHTSPSLVAGLKNAWAAGFALKKKLAGKKMAIQRFCP